MMRKSYSSNTSKSQLLLNRNEENAQRLQQRDILHKTPKRLIYKSTSGQPIVKNDSQQFKTEYSDHYSVTNSEVNANLVDVEPPASTPQPVDPLDTVPEQDLEFSRIQQAADIENSILDMGQQYPSFQVEKDATGTLVISHQKLNNNSSYRAQYPLYLAANSSYLNHHDQPVWKQAYSTKIRNLKVETTFQTDYKPFLTPVHHQTLKKADPIKQEFIGTSTYNNQYLNWGWQKQNLISEIQLPASLPGIAISNKTCYKDQFKGQKVKNERVASMKGNLSLGTLPFLSKTSSEAYAPKQGITRNITFQEEKKSYPTQSFKGQYMSEFKKEFVPFQAGPKSLTQVKQFLQKTLIKMN